MAKIHTLSTGATVRITETEWASVRRMDETRGDPSPREAILAILIDKFQQEKSA